MKSGNRKAWWFGKVIWNILSVLGFYLVLYLSVTAVSIVTGGFKAAQPEVVAFLLENQKIENAGTELYMYAMAVPVIVSLAISVTQMMIAVIFQPPMGYIWVCAVIATGIFIYSPYSLGNYLMLMRTPVLLHGSILNTLWAVVLGSLLILVSVVIGSITIEKKDIYS